MRALTWKRVALPAVAATGLLATVTACGPLPTATGPSTTIAPYVLPVASGVRITSMLTTGDAASASNGYEYVGIPDGLGARRQGLNDMVVFNNHELRSTQGVVRRHGQAGAFVSRLVIDRSTLEVKEGSDLIDPGTRFWDYPSGTYVASGMRFADSTAQDPAFSRFCSGYLSAPGQLYNGRTGSGYQGRIYFANEENGDPGRAFGVTTDGQATMLPRLGLFSWENTVSAQNLSDTTVVMGNEDSSSGQLRTYVGTKQRTGTPVEQAGLTNGSTFVIDATDPAVTTDANFRTTYPKGTPGWVSLNPIDWNATGAQQNVQAAASGLSLNRIEDGSFDPQNRNDYYFVTTEGGDTTPASTGTRDGGGLWRLRYVDVDRPALGGTLTLLLDGSEGLGTGESRMNKPDNVTIDRHGNLLIQEDPGGNDHIARIVAYRISDGALGIVARFDPAKFNAGADADPLRLTTDEESSGIIDTENVLGTGTFLFDAQVHTPKNLGAGTAELVENGQLLKMEIQDFAAVYGRPAPA